MDHDDWAGWRFAGRYLVTPHRERLTAEQLAHLVYLEGVRRHYERVGLAHQARQARARRAQRRQQLVTVVVVDLDTWKRERGLGAA